MPKKKYSQQCGPNLVFYDCRNEPDCAVNHKNCGGMFVQSLGPPNQNSYDKPDNHPGKIFCIECGHKLGRSVAAALKIGTNREHFYFPNRNEYELCARTYVDKNDVLRYWEWRYKDRPGLSEAASKELRDIKARMARKKKKVKKIVPFTLITQEEGDWTLVHPRITIRLPKEQFNNLDARKIETAWKSPANRDKTAEELQTIAEDVLGIGFSPIITHPKFFGIIEGTIVIILHRPAWDSETVDRISTMVKGLAPVVIKSAMEMFAEEEGYSEDSFTVEEDFLDKISGENPPLEEPVNPCADVEF